MAQRKYIKFVLTPTQSIFISMAKLPINFGCWGLGSALAARFQGQKVASPSGDWIWLCFCIWWHLITFKSRARENNILNNCLKVRRQTFPLLKQEEWKEYRIYSFYLILILNADLGKYSQHISNLRNIEICSPFKAKVCQSLPMLKSFNSCYKKICLNFF